ncbi:MAG: DUF177 domain-containing protein [Bacteroidota bacterium]|nr:DUF177 domain-containing protein [Bacteroidota bacterium]
MEKVEDRFTLKIRGLGHGSHSIDIAVPSESLDLPMFHGKITAKGQITVGESLLLSLRLEATGSFICDRCGCDFERTFRPEIQLLYVPPQLATSLNEDDDVHVFDTQTNEIDFTEDIRDAVMLAIPMKNLHSPDCKPLIAGEEKGILDDRLSALGGLYAKLREEEMNSEGTGSVSQG